MRWYTHRWLTEDYHQCLKTGCSIEKRQFDQGDDIRRLLGLCGPIAIRLLQLRNVARMEPRAPAVIHIDPLTIEVLTQRLEWTVEEPLTMGDFWRGVAQLGGHLARLAVPQRLGDGSTSLRRCCDQPADSGTQTRCNSK